MNIKPAHLKNDSNKYRQRKNEQEKIEMKENFESVNLKEVPEHYFVRNRVVYEILVSNLEKLGLSMHLKEIDTHSLVSISNTIDLINEIERDLKQYGTAQVIMTREGYTKHIPTPYAQMRSTNINLLQSQLKQLQLDPQSRQLLTSAVLNDVNMIDSWVEDDNDLVNSILERIG